MKILTVHARYALPGGEDEVFAAERDLLRQHGNEVLEHVEENASIAGQGKLGLATRTLWSRGDYDRIRATIRQNGVELVAVHNFFPLISPAVFHAAHAEGVPSVQTLHNYRLICPKATLMRDGALCDDCVGRTFPLPAVEHSCYRGSRVLSGVLASMLAIHHGLGTWTQKVTRYIALTEYMRDWFIAGGMPADRIMVKPNFVPDYAPGSGDGHQFVFVGRLTVEKGVSVLLQAWRQAMPDGTLKIIGSGPDEVALRAEAGGLSNVIFLGQQSRERVVEEMQRATAVVVPSIWPEPFGLTIIEALAVGTPVLATDHAGMASLVQPGRGGFVFPRADSAALGRLLQGQAALQALRPSARAVYEERFTPDRNYAELMSIYEQARNAVRRTA